MGLLRCAVTVVLSQVVVNYAQNRAVDEADNESVDRSSRLLLEGLTAVTKAVTGIAETVDDLKRREEARKNQKVAIAGQVGANRLAMNPFAQGAGGVVTLPPNAGQGAGGVVAVSSNAGTRIFGSPERLAADAEQASTGSGQIGGSQNTQIGGQSDVSQSTQTGGPSGVSQSTQTGSTGGAQTGGVVGAQIGGSQTTQTGGPSGVSQSTQTGSTGGAQTGGVVGAQIGGSQSTQTGSTGGAQTGGVVGAQIGGSQSTQTGGTVGAQTGGVVGAQIAGSQTSQTGGTAGAAGTQGFLLEELSKIFGPAGTAVSPLSIGLGGLAATQAGGNEVGNAGPRLARTAQPPTQTSWDVPQVPTSPTNFLSPL